MNFDDEFLKERYDLALGRIRSIREETGLKQLPAEYAEYFAAIARYLTLPEDVSDRKELNEKWYAPIRPGNYEKSFFSPEYAVSRMGTENGQLLAFLAAEMVALMPAWLENRCEEVTSYLELFVQVYGEFETEQQAVADHEIEAFDAAHVASNVRDVIYWFYYDNLDCSAMTSVGRTVGKNDSFLYRIVTEADLTTPDYLYETGACIGANEVGVAEYLAGKSGEEIERAAHTYVNGFVKGFEVMRRDLTAKDSVRIEYPIGFERIVREAVHEFEGLGLKCIITREGMNSIQGRRKRGAYCCGANPQFDYDHKNDKALYLDKNFTRRHMEALTKAYKAYKKDAKSWAGPAVIEDFGEEDFNPVNHAENLQFSDKQNKLNTAFLSDSGRLTNEYMPQEERSFTIIAFPLPTIADDRETFSRIFDATMELNTLDYELYEKMQAKIIDVLDQGTYAHVVGAGDNDTDIYVALHPLTDPASQTIFENCVADVNIPVGEVFTSPVLEGTYGRLNVKQVYLEGLQYRNLTFDFKDGKTVSYSCDNFETDEENRNYIFENILFRHDWLPIGEFAIGTNTTAYRMARDFGIEAKMPILIAEKTGPHFALGDTCYSEAEDQPMYNPDGKEVVARENSCSQLRHTDYAAAYFNCHTDITIPYDELALIEVIKADGSTEPIIVDGRFAVAGCEELNRPLDK